MNEELKKEVQEITIDTIRDLKRRGMISQAHEVLASFRRDVKNTKRQELINIRRKDRKIKVTLGYCASNGCNKKTERGNKLCRACRRRAIRGILRRVERDKNFAFLRNIIKQMVLRYHKTKTQHIS